MPSLLQASASRAADRCSKGVEARDCKQEVQKMHNLGKKGPLDARAHTQVFKQAKLCFLLTHYLCMHVKCLVH